MAKKSKETNTKKKKVLLMLLSIVLAIGLSVLVKSVLSKPKYAVGDCVCTLDKMICAQIEAIEDGQYKTVVASPLFGVRRGSAPTNKLDNDPQLAQVDCETGEFLNEKNNQ